MTSTISRIDQEFFYLFPIVLEYFDGLHQTYPSTRRGRRFMHIPLFAACWQYPALFLVPLITSCFSFALRYSREIATVAAATRLWPANISENGQRMEGLGFALLNGVSYPSTAARLVATGSDRTAILTNFQGGSAHETGD